MTDETIIGHYKVAEQIGSGAMGTLRIGRDMYIERPVAIKSLRSDFVRNPEFVARFLGEGKSLALLNHQNITALYAPICEGGQLHLVMELVRGKTLEAVLAERGRPLGFKQALAIVSQACDGLAYAHEMGVIHRDIKPSNLMIGNDGRVKIMDFGIARVQGSVRLTRMGAAVGTPLYMSPEQSRGEEGDERSDIYSLAAVLYEMLKGAPPFGGNSDYDRIQAQFTMPPPPLVPSVPGVSPALEATIMIALAKNPESRFASMKAFGDALGATEMRPYASKIIGNVDSLIDDTGNDGSKQSGALAVAESRTRAFLRNAQTRGRSLLAILGLAFVTVLGSQAYLFWTKSAPFVSRSSIAASDATPLAIAPALFEASVAAPSPPEVLDVATANHAVERTPVVPDLPRFLATPAAPPTMGLSSVVAEPINALELQDLRTVIRGSPGSRIRAADFEYLSTATRIELLPRARALAASGSAESQYVYGMLLLSTADHIDFHGAFQALSDAAAQDYPDSQTNLGLMYQSKKNLAPGGRDLERARFWFAKAAEKGDAKARYWLGCYNQFGWGGASADRQRAALDFDTAVEGGYDLAKAAAQALSRGSASPCLR
jgi:eukaryotic-like serine/threonine-protein kinase